MPERFLGDWPKDAFISFSQGLYLSSPQHYIHDSRPLRRCPRLPWKTVRTAVVKLMTMCSYVFLRFGETEVMVVINMFVSRYRLEIKEEPEFAGETFEERYARVTAFDEGISTM
jgi:hypothetical protein